jgi:TonB family protein
VFGFTEPSDKTRLEPVLGPTLLPAGESKQERTTSFITPADEISNKLPESGDSGARAQPAGPEAKNTGPRRLGPVGVHGFRVWPSGSFRNDHHLLARQVADWPFFTTSPTDGDVSLGFGLRLEDDERSLPARKERWWTRLRGPIGSLVLHLLPLLLLIDWPMSPPAEVTPIPVQLVFEPPPQAKPEPRKPQPKPTPARPRGRLASEDLGDPEVKETDRPKGDAPTANDNPAKADNPPSEAKEKPQQTAAIVPPPLPLAKSDTPRPDAVPKPAPKPSPAAHQPPRRVEEPGNLAPRRAKFPGPAATRDEYLAYMHSLIRQHYNLLTPAALGDRRGMVVVEFVVLDDGKVALIKVRRSSGYPDIDNRVAEMVAAVGRFPPLPQWFQGIAMPFEFGFPFPEALRE